jgi:hypothetical protein
MCCLPLPPNLNDDDLSHGHVASELKAVDNDVALQSEAWKQQNDNARIYYNEFLPGMFNRLADSEVARVRQRERQRSLETCFDRRIS